MFRAIGIACGILIIAIAVLWVMIYQRSEDIRQLQRFAAAGNSQAPSMINEFTRLESVSASSNAVIFHYTILLNESEIDSQSIKNQELEWFANVACRNEQVQSMVLKPGYEIIRSYRDVEQTMLFEFKLGSSNCQANT